MNTNDPHVIAKAAVKEVFYMLGVDVDDPKQVEAFRRDIRFSGDLRRSAAKGFGAFIAVLVTGAAAYIWSKIGHPGA